jgi:hypothetical protein
MASTYPMELRNLLKVGDPVALLKNPTDAPVIVKTADSEGGILNSYTVIQKYVTDAEVENARYALQQGGFNCIAGNGSPIIWLCQKQQSYGYLIVIKIQKP